MDSSDPKLYSYDKSHLIAWTLDDRGDGDALLEGEIRNQLNNGTTIKFTVGVNSNSDDNSVTIMKAYSDEVELDYDIVD